MDAIIIGAGIGGLTTALSLHAQKRCSRIRVFESVAELKALGVGINLLPHASRALSQLGLEPELKAVGVESEEQIYFTKHGQLVFREPSGRKAGHEWPHISIHRGDLQMTLLRAAQERIGAQNILCGRRCVAVEQDASGVIAHFAESKTDRSLGPERAHVLIACDGINSTVRKQLYPSEGEPIFHGINMWRGVTRAKPFLTGRSLARIGGIFTSGKLVVYPIRDNIDGNGTQLINWVAEAVTDFQETVDWNRAGKLADLLPIYGNWTFPWLDAVGLLKNSEFILSYPMVDRDPIEQWTFGRITLLGDAAHPMYPRGGNGGAQAILDAVAIAEHLVGDDVHGELKTYETARLHLTTKVVLENRSRPPDAIIDTVQTLTGGKRFDHLDDVISQDELNDLVKGYRQIAGYDLQSLRTRAP